jgi:hypothetical protein
MGFSEYQSGGQGFPASLRVVTRPDENALDVAVDRERQPEPDVATDSEIGKPRDQTGGFVRNTISRDSAVPWRAPANLLCGV